MASRQTSSTAFPSVTLIGRGNWGTALALALEAAGIAPREIVSRKAKGHARTTTLARATLDADVFWICTPDAAIAGVSKELANALAKKARRAKPVVFHSSGALASTVLQPLKNIGVSIASVHPLMTFPRRAASIQRLTGVPFAMEGDVRACRTARALVRAMGGESFTINPASKPLYHAFGAFTSPMLVALLTAAMETAVAAGLTPREARRRMRPIVERTMANFFADGPGESFSGPIARGDTATISRHLEALRRYPELRAAYQELARFALSSLPAKNKREIRQILAPPAGSSQG